MLMALLVLGLLALASADALHGIRDVVKERPEGALVLFSGALHTAFERPLPHTVDPTVLADFEEHFNRTQAFAAHGDNTFAPEGQQFVVRITDGYVNGVTGAVFDGRGQVYSQFLQATTSLPLEVGEIKDIPCKRFRKLATTIQKYGHMYYHFMQEVLPRVLLLKPFLVEDPVVKLLMFGSPYEAAWLEAVGIDASRVVMYDPTATYCADELLVPTLSEIITPAKETYDLVRSYFAQPVAPVAERDLIIYCSRSGASDRQVSNEEQLLEAMRTAFPTFHIITYTGSEAGFQTVAETLNLFRRARAVVGMHGAGLSHILFTPPGTAVVEITFMHDPPLMFWHASAAMNLEYWMVPQPQAYWLSPKVTVSQQDVIDAMAAALRVTEGGEDPVQCDPGMVFDDATRSCTACPAGTYRPASAARCIECEGGRYSGLGAAACRICPYDTYETGLTTCQACPEGTRTVLPGSGSLADCRTAAAVDGLVDLMFNRDQLANKLVRIPALMERVRTARGGGRRDLLHTVEEDVHSLQLSFLGDLFGEDNGRQLQGLDEDDDEDLHASGRQLSYVRRRLSAYGVGRRLAAYDGGRRLLAYGRRLAAYGSGRRLAAYDGGRRLKADDSIRRSMSAVGGRRLAQYSGRRRLRNA